MATLRGGHPSGARPRAERGASALADASALDGRVKPGHDERERFGPLGTRVFRSRQALVYFVKHCSQLGDHLGILAGEPERPFQYFQLPRDLRAGSNQLLTFRLALGFLGHGPTLNLYRENKSSIARAV